MSSIHVADLVGQPASSSWRIGLVIANLNGPRGPRVALTFTKPTPRIRRLVDRQTGDLFSVPPSASAQPPRVIKPIKPVEPVEFDVVLIAAGDRKI
jgi:hypothetical protein